MPAELQDDEALSVERQVRCVHCHWMVGHGERSGLGGPLRRDEIESFELAPTSTATTKRQDKRGSNDD